MDNKISQFLAKIQSLKKSGKLDLSLEEDLSLAVMNLISLEEHLYFTGAKTGKGKYYELLNQVREIRSGLLKKLVGQSEGEAWCVLKHLLAATMRLIEVGTKYQEKRKNKEAEEFFEKAWQIYSLFWEVKLGLKNVRGLKKLSQEKDLEPKLADLLKKLVDCCQ